MVISPRPFGQVLADAMNGLARIWRALLLPALVVSIPVSLITALVFRWTGGGDFLDMLVNNPTALQGLPEEVFLELARPFYIALGIATILQVLAGVFIALAAHRTVAADLGGTVLTGGEASRQALERYAVGLGASLLVVVTVVIMIILGAIVWLVPALNVGAPNLASALVAVLLFFAVLGPGIWVGVSASMTTSAVALEELGVLSSIRRSIRLVRGRWWPTASFLLIVGLLGGIAIQMIQLIALPLASVGGASVALTIASTLGVLAQGLLIAGISAIYTHWYIDLRARRELLTNADLS
jgi:CRP-like cAMP-binding protein